MKRAIVSFGTNKHAELLDISFPTFKAFGDRHGWDVYRADNIGAGRPAPWYKVRALINLLNSGYDEALFLGADTIIVDGREDLRADDWAWQALVQHHTGDGLVPNTDVWLCRKEMLPWLDKVWNNLRWLMHGWWEQASLMDLMGFHVEQPTYLKIGTELYMSTYFLDQSWNVHKWHKPPCEHPRIQHATMWPDRVAIMQEWRREADGWMNE